MKHALLYEQPLNEQIRLCLRLEHLFAQADHYLLGSSSWELRQTVSTIIEILNVADRPDLKNKLGQLLTQHAAALTQLESSPNVDKQKLQDMLQQIERLIEELRVHTQKTGQDLRDNSFLNAIQQRLHTPAGICNFSLPAYQLWLHQDTSALKKQLTTWLSSFKQLRSITNLLLKLTRESAAFKPYRASGGFYQNNLEPNLQHQLIRVRLAAEQNLFPEISVGRHRLAIHFFTLDLNGRTTQASEELTFELSCCKL